MQWYRNLGALYSMCGRYDDVVGEGDDVVFIALVASMCADDKVDDLALVCDATVERYIEQAKGLNRANARGYVECWRRYAERD